MKKVVKYCIILLCVFSLKAQTNKDINWQSFEKLELLQKQNPKPVFIYIYADWCVYCKKMNRVSFKYKNNIELLNQNYYALKFNLETEQEIVFDGKIFKNQELKTHRQPKHDLAKFLTDKQDKVSLPAIVILDEDFNIIKKLHTYLSPKQFNSLLKSL